MTIRFGVSPIAWANDDMPELGGDTPVEAILAEDTPAVAEVIPAAATPEVAEAAETQVEATQATSTAKRFSSAWPRRPAAVSSKFPRSRP